MVACVCCYWWGVDSGMKNTRRVLGSRARSLNLSDCHELVLIILYNVPFLIYSFIFQARFLA
ncbi:hypothetical protein NC652_008471 [Populus alba x Populus x berolinensis]|uniref:Uncharacterized protein n=1 Tax=Populus alba x Populus x berolinensis TaxID=444605 RepID=A0AAD6R6Y3_9ROSI|nr:hypothetical protein NC652_008471 [Populus alba x Populus x berolinensis]KAJ7003287.1 hypothetical protein NC653_008505 [Populus alba x Populus x berolinensis]